MALSVTYSFTNGTLADATEVNTNFSDITTRGLDKTGDTMTGTLKFSPDNTYDLGATSFKPRDGLFARNGSFGGTLSVTGDFKVNTNKFVVTASSGDTTVAGTLGVTGNVTLSGTGNSVGTITTGVWNGTAVVTTYGGTGVTSWSAGDLPYYASGTALSKLTVGSTGQVLTVSGGVPAWTTATFPATASGTGTVLRADGTNWVATTATYPAAAGTSGTVLQSNGTGFTNTTATYPGTATSTGTILRADGTNWVATTATYPTTTAAGDVLYSNGANAVTGLTKGTAYQVLMMNSGATAPEWTSTLGVTGTRLTAGFFLDLTVTNKISGSITGNCDGTAATVTGATQAAITSAANLATVGTITTGVWNAGAVTSTGALTSSLSTAASAIVVNTNKFTVEGSTGNTVVAGTFQVGASSAGNAYLSVTPASKSFKFAYSGPPGSNVDWITFDGTTPLLTVAAGLSATGDFKVNTDKFTVASSTGNTVVAGTLTAAGDVGLAATKKLYLDGVAMTGDTYISESSANTLSLFSGNVEAKLTSGVLTVSGFGTHSFSGGAGSNGINEISLTNSSTGDVAAARLLFNTATANAGQIGVSGTGYTSVVTWDVQNSMQVRSALAGGLSIAATHASGAIRFYSGGTTLRGTISASTGGLVWDYAVVAGNSYGFYMGTWGTTASAANAYVSDSGYLVRSTSLRQFKNVGDPISYDEGIAVVRGLSAVHYTSKIATDDKRVMVGLIAEDVEFIASPLAQYNNGILGGVAYDRVPMYLLPVVKQHDAAIYGDTGLLHELSALRARVATLEAQLSV